MSARRRSRVEEGPSPLVVRLLQRKAQVEGQLRELHSELLEIRIVLAAINLTHTRRIPTSGGDKGT